MSNWLWVEDALARAGRPSKRSGNELLLHCPYCDDSKYHLYFNVAKGVWTCFKCNEKGRALKLLKELGVKLPGIGYQMKRAVVVAPPKITWPEHKALKPGSDAWRYLLDERKMTPGDIAMWQLRVGAGLNQDYVLWPVLDADGELRGVHLRRYRFQGDRALMFPKLVDRLMLGAHIVAQGSFHTVVIVEGPYDAAHVTRELWEDGFISLALMGHSITRLQCLQLKAIGLPAVIMLDADAAEDTRQMARDVARWLPVRKVYLTGKDPKHLPRAQLLSLLG